MTLKKIKNNAKSHASLLNQSSQLEIDYYFMKKAIRLALKGQSRGEVPVGAILVDEKQCIVAKASNVRETQNTVLGHAELAVLHRACRRQKSWRLTGCTLYVTLEPCFMCAGALIQARVSRVVFATPDPKGGALVSLAQLGHNPKLNHEFSVTQGILAEESSRLLKEFFKNKRATSKKLTNL